MTDRDQLSIDEAASDRPRTGEPIDERTHYAHPRYAASENPGTIWYDPRDGREILTIDVETSTETMDVGDEVVTSLKLAGHRNRCGLVDPNQKWLLEVRKARLVEYEPIGDTDETKLRVENSRATETYESQAEARDAAEEQFDAYAEAEYRDAVEYRLNDAGVEA